MFVFELFVRLLCVVACVGVVLAQDVYIVSPTANTNVVAGSDLVVQIDKPRSLTGSQDVAVVIATMPCQSPSECPDVTQVLGDVLYSGPYNSESYNDYYYPYENFTITVPSWYSGTVQLGVAHFYLLGAGFSALLRFANTTLNVAASG